MPKDPHCRKDRLCRRMMAFSHFTHPEKFRVLQSVEWSASFAECGVILRFPLFPMRYSIDVIVAVSGNVE
jgi:hypothetical protein